MEGQSGIGKDEDVGKVVRGVIDELPETVKKGGEGWFGNGREVPYI